MSILECGCVDPVEYGNTGRVPFCRCDVRVILFCRIVVGIRGN